MKQKKYHDGTEISMIAPVVTIAHLEVAEPFESLFIIDSGVLNAIKEDIQKNGYNASQPITVWKRERKMIVIDGHTRLQAAKDLGLEYIHADLRSFKDETEAIEFAIHMQHGRRNLSDADILNLVEKVDELLPQGGDRRSSFVNPKLETDGEVPTSRGRRTRRSKEDDEESKKDSRERTAKLIGISKDKVSQCRHIIEHCDRTKIDKVMYGELTIHGLYRSSLRAQKNADKKFDQHEIDRQTIQEFKGTELLSGKISHKHLHKLDTFVLKLLPELYKREDTMYKIAETVQYLKSRQGDVFDKFCKKKIIQEFLGHLFTMDFISVLECFGYKIEKPADLKIIEQKRVPKIDRRKGKMPVFNISQIHDINYVSREDREILDKRLAEVVKRDLTPIK